MLFLVAFERIQAAPQSSCSNAAASSNILSMSVTLLTFHFERSLLNEYADQNMPCISNTFDTSHLERSLLNDLAYQVLVGIEGIAAESFAFQSRFGERLDQLCREFLLLPIAAGGGLGNGTAVGGID